MPLVQTRGAASAQGFGEFAQVTAANYIEDVFSSYLWTGTGAALTITNNIDLSTKGGLVWIKSRSAGENHSLTDTARTADFQLASSTNLAQTNEFNRLTAFTTSGFSLSTSSLVNASAATYVGWTFRKQPKFFDVVTYTGTGSNTTIAHNLGSVPGCIIVKCTSHGVAWNVYHRSLTSAAYELELNTTSAEFSDPTIWNSTAPTSTVFSVGTNLGINGSGRTYVAYLFAHDAGGFGLAGTDNVISCGLFSTDGSGNATVSLGYEPQWLMVKASTYAQSWYIEDNMRAFNLTSRAILFPNLSNAEATGASAYLAPNSTGFAAVNGQLNASTDYIYIAIRRGPMKVPTLGTSVFKPTTGTASVNSVVTTGFATDMVISAGTAAVERGINDRLRGFPTTNTGTSPWLVTQTTAAEANYSGTNSLFNATNTTFQQGYYFSGLGTAQYSFLRAPSFFDEVCYTGTGAGTTFNHNLGAVPELIIVKRRDTTGAWDSYSSALANTEYVVLNTTAAKATGATRWNSTTPTSSVFSVGTSTTTNASAGTYVAYLFATCAGVSKVGSYTGTATTLQIDCGFTGGARFVLIKRTDSTGDWYVWDSARGIVAGNDPYLLLNSSAAEVTSTDYIDTYSAGFEISSTAPAAINASAGTFVFLAIA